MQVLISLFSKIKNYETRFVTRSPGDGIACIARILAYGLTQSVQISKWINLLLKDRKYFYTQKYLFLIHFLVNVFVLTSPAVPWISCSSYLNDLWGARSVATQLLFSGGTIDIYIYIYIIQDPRRDSYFFRIHLFILFLHTCMFPSAHFCQRTCMAQGLVNGIFNETRTHSCLQIQWFSVGFYAGFFRVCLP